MSVPRGRERAHRGVDGDSEMAIAGVARPATVARCAVLVLLQGQLARSQAVPPGWRVVLKTNGDDTFQYSSPYWTDTTTVLDDSSDPEAPGNAKYAKYNLSLIHI